MGTEKQEEMEAAAVTEEEARGAIQTNGRLATTRAFPVPFQTTEIFPFSTSETSVILHGPLHPEVSLARFPSGFR